MKLVSLNKKTCSLTKTTDDNLLSTFLLGQVFVWTKLRDALQLNEWQWTEPESWSACVQEIFKLNNK